VSLRVDYDERAIDQAAAFLDDPPGIRSSRPSRGRSASGYAQVPTDDRFCMSCMPVSSDGVALYRVTAGQADTGF
jgi:hypothetical protein